MCSKLSVTSQSVLRAQVMWTRDRTYSGDHLDCTARRLRICCSSCGKNAALSSRRSGAETTKPGREATPRAGSALVALKSKHAYALRVAQSSRATGRSRPAE